MGMKNHDSFKERLIKSVESQTFTDYELIFTYEGKMAENTNAAMRQAKGDIIKILYLDDYFANEFALQNIVNAFDGNPECAWLATGCFHDDGVSRYLNAHVPHYNEDILSGKNTIGSPSVMSLRDGLEMYFDEKLSWLLDCDLYYRLNEKYGAPILIPDLDIAIGIGDHQTSVLMPESEKIEEFNYIKKKNYV